MKTSTPKAKKTVKASSTNNDKIIKKIEQLITSQDSIAGMLKLMIKTQIPDLRECPECKSSGRERYYDTEDGKYHFSVCSLCDGVGLVTSSVAYHRNG